MTTASSPWLVESRTTAAPRRRLICLPFAGGGAAMYAPWHRALPGTAISAVRLPGRENRFREPPLTDVGAVVDALLPVVSARVTADADLPWGIFGYSLGGLLAYELAVRLAETGGPVPSLLAVGGSEPPHVPRELPDLSWLPDEEFVRALKKIGGTDPQVFEHAELLALMLPMVRADFRILETFPTRSHPPLACPIVTYRGREDHEIRPETMARWSELTAASLTHHELSGGHFVVTENPDELLARVGDDLALHVG